MSEEKLKLLKTDFIDSNQASILNIYFEFAKDITGYEAVLFQ